MTAISNLTLGMHDRRRLVRAARPVLEEEVERHQRRQDRRQHRHDDDEVVEVIDLCREGRRLLRQPQQAAHQIVHAALPVAAVIARCLCFFMASSFRQRTASRPASARKTSRGPDAHEADHERRVAAGGGVIAVTGHQHLVERGADASAARLDDRHAEVARRVVDAVQVAGDDPFGRQHERDGVVRELLAGRVELVAEADRVGEGARGRAAVGDRRPEWPVRRVLAARQHEHALLRRGEQLGVFRGIDADVDGQEVLPQLETRHARGLHQPVEHQAAQHRAAMVPERDQHRLAPAEQRLDARPGCWRRR